MYNLDSSGDLAYYRYTHGPEFDFGVIDNLNYTRKGVKYTLEDLESGLHDPIPPLYAD